MKITFSSTAYVQATASELDMLNREINHWADGNENVCTSVEELENTAECDDISSDLRDFINVTMSWIAKKSNGGSIGDVIFHK